MLQTLKKGIAAWRNEAKIRMARQVCAITRNGLRHASGDLKLPMMQMPLVWR